MPYPHDANICMRLARRTDRCSASGSSAFDTIPCMTWRPLAVTSEQKKRFNVSRCSGPHGHRRRRGAVHGRLHDGGAAADLGCDASAERAAKRRQRGRRRLKAGRPRCRGCQRYKVGIASRAELPRIRVLASLLTALSGRLPADSVARQDFPRTRAVVVRAAMASELFKKQM